MLRTLPVTSENELLTLVFRDIAKTLRRRRYQGYRECKSPSERIPSEVSRLPPFRNHTARRSYRWCCRPPTCGTLQDCELMPEREAQLQSISKIRISESHKHLSCGFRIGLSGSPDKPAKASRIAGRCGPYGKPKSRGALREYSEMADPVRNRTVCPRKCSEESNPGHSVSLALQNSLFAL